MIILALYMIESTIATGPVTNTNTNSNSNSDTSTSVNETTDNIAEFLLIMLAIVFAFCLIMKIIHSKIKYFRGSDQSNYFQITIYCQNVCDLFTDVLFVYIAHANDEMLYYYVSLAFTLVPYLMTLFYLVYFISRWSNKRTYRLTRYLNKHLKILIVLTLLSSDFYSSVALLKSQIFCLNMFNIPLKQTEYEKLYLVKFVSKILFEVWCLFEWPFLLVDLFISRVVLIWLKLGLR